MIGPSSMGLALDTCTVPGAGGAPPGRAPKGRSRVNVKSNGFAVGRVKSIEGIILWGVSQISDTYKHFFYILGKVRGSNPIHLAMRTLHGRTDDASKDRDVYY